ncbi:MAG: phospho-N-acetylmuramoyl-pentapeptide-transferase [Clostridiales bacterium]
MFGDTFLAWNIISFIVSFLITVFCGPVFIPILTKLKFGQTIRDDGPASHLVKTGTPTMGGVMFIIPIFIISVILSFLYPEIVPMAFATVGFGLVGFVDDYLKIKKKSKDGLFPKQKMLGLLIIALLFAFYLTFISEMKSDFAIMLLGIDITFGFKFLFIIYVIFVFVATTNSVNMTDGLDGLASGVTLVVMMFFAVVAVILGDIDHIQHFSSIVAGGCLGFLVYNLYPAKIFMGDTGSLALGGAVASLIITMKLPPIIVVFVCAMYIIEALSVIIQVVSYKKRKKRVFRMAPIHHHFELIGWSESRVVNTFWLSTFVICVLGGILYYYNIY